MYYKRQEDSAGGEKSGEGAAATAELTVTARTDAGVSHTFALTVASSKSVVHDGTKRMASCSPSGVGAHLSTENQKIRKSENHQKIRKKIRRSSRISRRRLTSCMVLLVFALLACSDYEAFVTAVAAGR